MRLLFTISLFFASLIVVAQNDTITLKNAMSQLDKALLNKDQQTLQQLLSRDVSYGHSNGWVQTRKDVLGDLQSGKLVYSRIENSNVMIVAVGKKWATVRTNTNAEGSVSGTAFQLKLHVLQVWMNTKKGWQLLARQSIKL